MDKHQKIDGLAGGCAEGPGETYQRYGVVHYHRNGQKNLTVKHQRQSVRHSLQTSQNLTTFPWLYDN